MWKYWEKDDARNVSKNTTLWFYSYEANGFVRQQLCWVTVMLQTGFFYFSALLFSAFKTLLTISKISIASSNNKSASEDDGNIVIS